MYVCICNNVTDTQIRVQVEKGQTSLDQIRNTLKVATVCGQCQCTAQTIIDQALMQNKAAVASTSTLVAATKQFIPQVA